MKLRGTTLLALGLLAVSRPARADKDPCIAAYEETQTRRKDGKLIEAKREAAICARAECPAMLSKDCARWHAELDASIPSVVLEARSPTGGELTNVRVSVDGASVADRIDGKATLVDPGSRTFRFETDGAPPVERVIVVREGEKNRKVSVIVAAPHAGRPESRPIPAGVWIFGGASIVALGAAAIFTLDGLGKKSDLDSCKPRCASSDVDSMSASFTWADLALGAGVMAGLAATWLYVTRPAVEPGATSARVIVTPAGIAGRF